MKKPIVYLIIFIFVLFFKTSLAAANIDCSDGSCTIPAEMFDFIKNRNSQLTKLDHAKTIYETFGYVSEIVELAKTDPEAAKELAAIKNKLKLDADAGKAFEKMQLGQIYYLEGDFDNFRRYANPQHIKSLKMISQAFGIAFEDNSLISAISGRGNDYNNISNFIFNSYMNSGNMELAKKIFESDSRFADSCNYGQVVNMYINLYRDRNDENIKDKFVKYLASVDVQDDSDIVGLLYILTNNDAKYQEIAQEVSKKIHDYPEQRRYRILLNAANQLSDNDSIDKYIEKAWECKMLNSWELNNYANKIIFGSSKSAYNYESIIPKEALKNPKLDTAIEILEKNYENDFSVARILLGIYKLKGDRDSYFKVVDNIIPRLSNSYDFSSFLQLLLLPSEYYYQDATRAEKIIESLNEHERGTLMNEVGTQLLYHNSMVFEHSPSKALDYFYKSLDFGHEASATTISYYLDFDSMIALFDKYSDNKLMVFMKAMYLAENQKWEDAIKNFERAKEMGCNRATGIMYGMKLLGLYEGNDKSDANALLDDFLSKLGDPCSQSKLNIGGADNNFIQIFGSKSKVLLEFYKRAAKIKKYSDWANDMIASYNLNLPLLSDEKEVLIRNRIKDLESQSNIRAIYSLISLYSMSFESPSKILELYKKLSDLQNYNKSEYVIELFKAAYSEEDKKRAFDELKKISYYNSELRDSIMALCYENGIGVERDTKKAQELREKITLEVLIYNNIDSISFATPKQIANEKSYYIQKILKESSTYPALKLRKFYEFLGNYYEKSPSPYKNPEKALEYYLKACEINPLDFDNVIRLYNSNTALKDDKKYFDSLLKYKDNSWKDLDNYHRAKLLYDIAFCHLNGRGTEKSPEAAYALFKEIQKMPVTAMTFNAMEAEAYCLQHGLGVKASLEGAEAIRKNIKEIALKNAYPLNMYRAVCIAFMYNSKNLLGKNTDMYEYWANFAVDENPNQHIINGLYNLFTNSPKNRDMEKAQKYADLYAKYWGYTPKSLHRIGVFELFGINRPQNVQAGLESLKKAATYENAAATEALAYAYEKGIGVEKDEKQAKEYLNKLKRLKPNYVSLADNYIRGRYGIEDPDRAKFILELGASEGSEDSAENLKNFDDFSKKIRESN